MAVSGLAMGIIDTIANFRLVSMYKKDSAIFLQVSEDILYTVYITQGQRGVDLLYTYIYVQ